MKGTHMDKYLDFQFPQPLAHRVAVARTLFDCVKKICCKGTPDQWLAQKACSEELASTTMPTAA